MSFPELLAFVRDSTSYYPGVKCKAQVHFQNNMKHVPPPAALPPPPVTVSRGDSPSAHCHNLKRALPCGTLPTWPRHSFTVYCECLQVLSGVALLSALVVHWSFLLSGNCLPVQGVGRQLCWESARNRLHPWSVDYGYNTLQAPEKKKINANFCLPAKKSVLFFFKVNFKWCALFYVMGLTVNKWTLSVQEFIQSINICSLLLTQKRITELLF